jgi:excisionase family DNA binding protein
VRIPSGGQRDKRGEAVALLATKDVSMTSRKLLTVQEAATYLAVSVSTLYGWVYQRRIPFVKIGRALRFDASDLVAFVDARRTRPPDPATMRARLAKGRKRAAMGIYKRGNVYWIDFYDQNRNRVQESSLSTDRQDAEDLLTVRRSEILRGVYKQPVKITFGEFGERYMEHAKTNKRS